MVAPTDQGKNIFLLSLWLNLVLTRSWSFQHERPPVDDEDASMVAPEHMAHIRGVLAANSQGEALGGDAVGRIEKWGEYDFSGDGGLTECAEHGELPVAGAEEAEEDGVSGEAPPALADKRGARERGG